MADMRRPATGFIAALFTAALVWAPSPAAAACHIAVFDPPTYSVGEADGNVTLRVVLQGRQPTCAGSVDFQTVDQTARAGQDYVAASGTLQFVQGDDREETITVQIINNDVVDGDKTFQVRLSNPQGTISGIGGPATVTIVDDDQPPPPPAPPPPAPAAPAEPDPEPEEPEEPEEPVEPEPEPEPEESPIVAAEEAGGIPPMVVAGIIALIVLAAGGGVWWLRRRSARPS